MIKMIKAVLIDDERPALRCLEHLLQDYPAVEIAGAFINPLEALEQIADIKPRIVFLDIHMPQLQGIDAASGILDQCPDTDIIFVTAFDQYAIEAFELHALDYILKPIAKERFAKTLQRLINKNSHLQVDTKMRLEIKCFGRFQMGWTGEEPIKWRTEKTRELFAFLLHHQGREVSKDEIIDNLWPEVELDKAVHQLHNGIYYIRKTLAQSGIDRSLVSISGSYSMKLGEVAFDVRLFREGLKKVSDSIALEDLAALEAIYTGEYMAGTDWVWADLEREVLSRKYAEIMERLAQDYIEQEEFGRAEELLIKAFDRNPYDEGVSRLLLKLYRLTGDKVKAVKHYAKYEQILQEELGIKPQERIRQEYTAIT